MTIVMNLYEPNIDEPLTQLPQFNLTPQIQTKPNTPLTSLFQSKYPFNTSNSLTPYPINLYETYRAYLTAYKTL